MEEKDNLVNLNRVKSFLLVNKEGIIIGSLIGFLVGKFILPDMIDFSLMGQTFGLIDIIQEGSKSAGEIAKTKLVWASTILGGTIGLLIDMSLPENKGRMFR